MANINTTFGIAPVAEEISREMGKTIIRPELEAEFVAVAASEGCEILEIENRGHALRIILDRPDGVSLGHCERVSRQLSALLDVAEYGSKKYVLEVSSPGLDRKLYGPHDYERFQGQQVRVTYFVGPERQKRTIVGRLAGYTALEDGNSFEDGSSPKPDGPNGNLKGHLTILETKTESEHQIPLANLKVIRLEIEL